jgi:hypothetical protein
MQMRGPFQLDKLARRIGIFGAGPWVSMNLWGGFPVSLRGVRGLQAESHRARLAHDFERALLAKHKRKV